LIELPGLNVSILANTSAWTTSFVIRLIRTIGVQPMASRIVEHTFLPGGLATIDLYHESDNT
jgi:hypothetical protein